MKMQAMHYRGPAVMSLLSFGAMMCERASVMDPEISTLCKDILSSQKREIDQMRAKLAALGG